MNAPRISQDLSLILISIIAAVLIANSDATQNIVSSLPENLYLASFVTGIFFTSIFTTAPAIVILAELSQEGHLLFVALFGGLGAVIGDYVLFRFFKDRFAEDVVNLFSCSRRKKLELLFNKKIFRFITPFLGAVIIASPFPDEFAIMLLGMSQVKTLLFIPVSFTFNTIGIYIIGIIANIS